MRTKKGKKSKKALDPVWWWVFWESEFGKLTIAGFLVFVLAITTMLVRDLGVLKTDTEERIETSSIEPVCDTKPRFLQCVNADCNGKKIPDLCHPHRIVPLSLFDEGNITYFAFYCDNECWPPQDSDLDYAR